MNALAILGRPISIPFHSRQAHKIKEAIARFEEVIRTKGIRSS